MKTSAEWLEQLMKRPAARKAALTAIKWATRSGLDKRIPGLIVFVSSRGAIEPITFDRDSFTEPPSSEMPGAIHFLVMDTREQWHEPIWISFDPSAERGLP